MQGSLPHLGSLPTALVAQPGAGNLHFLRGQPYAAALLAVATHLATRPSPMRQAGDLPCAQLQYRLQHRSAQRRDELLHHHLALLDQLYQR
ncbi:MAG: hypothetical protein ACUVX8_08950 [Candidatus Zipacnadales bacterium]